MLLLLLLSIIISIYYNMISWWRASAGTIFKTLHFLLFLYYYYIIMLYAMGASIFLPYLLLAISLHYAAVLFHGCDFSDCALIWRLVSLLFLKNGISGSVKKLVTSNALKNVMFLKSSSIKSSRQETQPEKVFCVFNTCCCHLL